MLSAPAPLISRFVTLYYIVSKIAGELERKPWVVAAEGMRRSAIGGDGAVRVPDVVGWSRDGQTQYVVDARHVIYLKNTWVCACNLRISGVCYDFCAKWANIYSEFWLAIDCDF
jgi:hypothetical protein